MSAKKETKKMQTFLLKNMELWERHSGDATPVEIAIYVIESLKSKVKELETEQIKALKHAEWLGHQKAITDINKKTGKSKKQIPKNKIRESENFIVVQAYYQLCPKCNGELMLTNYTCRLCKGNGHIYHPAEIVKLNNDEK